MSNTLSVSGWFPVKSLNPFTPRFPVSFACSVHVAQNIGPILIALLQSQTEGNLAHVSWFQIFWTTNLKASVALTSNKTMQ